MDSTLSAKKKIISSQKQLYDDKSSQIFEKVVDENLSTVCEMTAKHGFFGPEKVLNDAKGRRKEEKKREVRGEKTIHNAISKKHEYQSSGSIFICQNLTTEKGRAVKLINSAFSVSNCSYILVRQ